MIHEWRRRLSNLPDEFVFNQDARPPFEEWVTQAVGAFRLHTHPLTKVRRFPGESSEVLVVGTIVAEPEDVVTTKSCPAGQYVAMTPTEVFSDAGSLKQVGSPGTELEFAL